MTSFYVLDPEAKADLREVVRYTRKQWGAAQIRTYKDQLKQCMDALAKGTGFYTDLSAIHPNLRTVRCQEHHIFMLTKKDDPAVVLAIFHKRMNMMVRLKKRLATKNQKGMTGRSPT